MHAFAVEAVGNGLERWQGQGRVEVRQPASHLIEWKERGRWTTGAKGLTSFRNTYRWALRPEQDCLSLAHLRRGPNQPTSLLDLEPVGEGRFVARAPHRCSEDRYTAEVYLASKGLVLVWHIAGPKKDMRLRTEYR